MAEDHVGPSFKLARRNQFRRLKADFSSDRFEAIALVFKFLGEEMEATV